LGFELSSLIQEHRSWEVRFVNRSKRWLVGLALLAGLFAGGCADTPQLGSDEASWTTADALWTAITAKNPTMVEDCAKRIRKLETSGKLAPETAAALQALIEQAREGDWDDARGELKTFVQGQRRPA
jgi:hypothetical protein